MWHCFVPWIQNDSVMFSCVFDAELCDENEPLDFGIPSHCRKLDCRSFLAIAEQP